MKILGEAEKVNSVSRAIVPYQPAKVASKYISKLDAKLEYQTKVMMLRIEFDRRIDSLAKSNPIIIDGQKLNYSDTRHYYLTLFAKNEDSQRSNAQRYLPFAIDD